MIKLILVTGGKGKGKTWLTRKAYLNDDEKNVLIFDYFNEYKDVEEITIREVSEFCTKETPSTRRLSANPKLSTKIYNKMFLGVLKDFKKGVFIGDAFVDMIRSAEVESEIYKMMIGSRHVKEDLEIILHFHDYKGIPKRWLTLPEGLRLHQEM